MRVDILDTTLRDGAQGEGVSFSVNDKLKVARALDKLGVAYIEAGNPFSNPKDAEFFAQAQKLNLKTARLAAFGSTIRTPGMAVDDAGLKALLAAQTPVVCLFGKAWDLHVEEILRVSMADNLRMVQETVAYAKGQGREVIFDAEHFFDGYADNPAYALEVLRAASAGGASSLCLCDTNGGAMPMDIHRVVAEVVQALPGEIIGIHCHNDAGCAVANSLLAVQAGARQVQGTFTGAGERCGNADLSVLIPNLQLKQGHACITGAVEGLYGVAREIAEVSNIRVPRNKPYVGSSAFAHKGGMHIDGVSKNPRSFEHMNPECVGNRRRFLLSEVSGRQAVLTKLGSIAPQLGKNSPQTAEILEELKRREYQGYQYEGADASFDLLVRRVLGIYQPHFKLVLYKTSGEFPPPDGQSTSSAMVQVDVNGSVEMTAALGNGPVHALDLALRKALGVFYPSLNDMVLTDFKVRVLETGDATGSAVRVLVTSADGQGDWTTVGVSTDIIEASFFALVDAIEYKLCQQDALG